MSKNKLICSCEEYSLCGTIDPKSLRKNSMSALLIAGFVAIFILAGCSKPDNAPTPASNAQNELRNSNNSAGCGPVNLISDVPEYGAALIDTNLVNAWGMAFSSGGGIWVSAADKGLSTIYSGQGSILRLPVAIPFNGDPNGGEPTGQVFNSTTGFVIPSTLQISRFIFATENGTIAAWASGNNAIQVRDRSSAGAVYKGLEMVNTGGAWVLYATDFHNGKVDIFDQNFNFVGNGQFSDPSIPSGYAPFNIRKIGDRLFVTYAKQLAGTDDDEAGAGNGYVNIFNLDGTLISRFTSQGTLNSPWGIEQLLTDDENDQGENEQGDEDGDGGSVEASPFILIGNFGDGHISVFNSHGKFIKYLSCTGAPIEIEGLWAISYPPQGNTAYQAVSNRIYFTAGPDGEEHGLFGYLNRKQ